eukprot:5934408-Amphidinium_carterae.1
MNRKGFTLVMGPKNVGKTKALKCECTKDTEACIYIDGRWQRSLALALALFHALSHPEVQEQEIMNMSSFQNAAFGQRVTETRSTVVNPSCFAGAGISLYGHSHVGVEQCAHFAQRWPDLLARLGRFTLVLDEARRILGAAGVNNDDVGNLVMLAKQNRKVHVLMASSEGAFPYDIEEFEGIHEENLRRFVYAPELQEDKLQSELKQWGVTASQAEVVVVWMGLEQPGANGASQMEKE